MGIFNNKYSYTSNTEYVSEGYEIINSIRKNPENVPLYLEEGTYYLAASDLVKYMESAELTDVEEALESIANHNCIESFDIGLVDDSKEELSQISESVNEYLTEAVEDEAMNLRQAKKYYNKVLSKAKTAKGTKEELQARIKILKDCVREMKAERDKAERTGSTSGKTKYLLKSLIPFNHIWRLIKRNDMYAALGALGGTVINFFAPGIGGAVFEIGYKAMGYTKMLDDNIEKTEEAIKYLEDRVKEMK